MILILRLVFGLFILATSSISTSQACIANNCQETISHFIFKNENTFALIDYYDEKSQPYLTRLQTVIKLLEKKIANQEQGWVDSVKDKFRTAERKTEILENALLTHNSTYLVINELFSKKKIEKLQLKPKDPHLVTARLSSEILELIKKRIIATNNWIVKLNPQNPFFGFSLIKSVPISWSTWTKNLLGNLSPYIKKTTPQSRFFYMTSLLKTIFIKINKLFYWHYVLKKINQTGIDSRVIEEIGKELGNWIDALEKYNTKIGINITNNPDVKDPDKRLEGHVESKMVSSAVGLIKKNNAIVNSLIPKKVMPRQKIAEIKQVLCVCPYLQTDIKILEIKATDNQTESNYKTKLFEHLLNLMESDRPEQFCQLAIICYQLWPSELEWEENSLNPNSAAAVRVKNGLSTIKSKQLAQYNEQCNLLIKNISVYWTNQLWKKNAQESWTAFISKSGPRAIQNLWRNWYYFFGFSLLISSKKNSDFNRHTYMITQLEKIFETINLLLPWYHKSMMNAICQQKNSCNIFSEIIGSLNAIIQALQQYQSHFFSQLLSSNTTPKDRDIVLKLANLKHPHGVQIGIEYAIVDRVIAWINENITIIKTVTRLQDDPKIIPQSPGEIKQKGSLISKEESESSDGEYHDPLGNWQPEVEAEESNNPKRKDTDKGG